MVGDRRRIPALARLAAGHRRPRSRRARPPADQSQTATRCWNPVRAGRPLSRRCDSPDPIRRCPWPSCSWPAPGSTSRPSSAGPKPPGSSANESAGSPPRPGLQYRARLYRLVALVEMGRYVEAEREAQSHSSWRVPTEHDALFDAVRLLDHCAATAESDLRQRRFGLVLRLIVEPLVTAPTKRWTPTNSSELAMRLTRALLSIGADREARRSVAAWRGGPQSTDERAAPRPGRHLQPARGLLARHRRPASAAQEQPIRIAPLARRPLRPGPGLFPHRQAKEAAQLIDSTAILHPELGGNALHDKFIHLRQRLGLKP